jgi:hypothetical protein
MFESQRRTKIQTNGVDCNVFCWMHRYQSTSLNASYFFCLFIYRTTKNFCLKSEKCFVPKMCHVLDVRLEKQQKTKQSILQHGNSYRQKMQYFFWSTNKKKIFGLIVAFKKRRFVQVILCVWWQLVWYENQSISLWVAVKEKTGLLWLTKDAG